MGAIQGNLLKFGKGGGRPRRIQKGSPEHNLLTEAKVVTGGGHLPGRTEAGMRADRRPIWRGFETPEGKGKGNRIDLDLGKSQPGTGEIENPSSQEVSKKTGCQPVENFPRDPG